MTQTSILPLARLPRAQATDFALIPDEAALRDLAEDLGAERLRKVRLEGSVTPEGDRDWQLTARLGATAIQACGVTGAPVTTRIDIDVSRRYLADLPAPAGEEMEMPEDDTLEPLPRALDLRDLLAEALSLALPDYPRAPDADLGEAIFAAPGIRPMTDEDAKPLAGLAALRDKLASGTR